jgi:beta-glucosidase
MWARWVLAACAALLAAAAPASADSADVRAHDLVAQMTQPEKFGLMAGACDPHGHTGFVPGIPRLGIPDLYLNDGPVGVHEEPPTFVSQDLAGECATFQTGEVGEGRSTQMPAPIALAATFDPSLAHAYGAVVGDEAARTGNQVIFGPDINIMRDPRGGRTFEAYGEDPYLAGRMAVGWIRGLQGQHVIADVKHFMANNEENGRQASNSIVGEQAMHEIYMPAFEAAVKQGHAGSVMAAYNKVNGTWMTENDPLLNGVLKKDWGFDGWVLTDYGAQHSTVAAANAGTDMELPYHQFYDQRLLSSAVASGQVSQATIDDHVLRIVRTMVRFGLLDHPEWWKPRPIDYAAHAAVARHIAAHSIVLLRNRGALLPLGRHVRSIAVIGADATSNRSGGGSSKIATDRSVSPLDAIRARAGKHVKVLYDDGSDPQRAAQVAANADVALVFAYDVEGENADRKCVALECSSSDPDQDGLIDAVAAANKRTVVVLTTGAPVLTPWAAKLAGIVEAWYPGEDGGEALAAVLFGDVDPGGRLPVTFPQRQEDLPAHTADQWPGRGDLGDAEQLPDNLPPPANVLPDKQIFYSEGPLVGYRWYDAQRLRPAFPFGFGLSYTRFRYSRPVIENDRVAVEVTNVGRRKGSDVAQLYVAIPSPGPGVVEPPRQLKGFARVSLRPRQTKRVDFRLDARSFAYWDSASHRWIARRGCYQARIGRSSRDLVRALTLPWGRAGCARTKRQITR